MCTETRFQKLGCGAGVRAMSRLHRAMREVLFALVVAAVTATLTLIVISSAAALLFYVIIPIICILFLTATRTRVNVDPVTAVTDLKRYWKVMAAFTLYNVVLVTAGVLIAGNPGREWSRISTGFIISNPIEELLYRATLIPLFEMIGQRLFDMTSTGRAIVSTSIAFSLGHVRNLLFAGSVLARGAAIVNMFSAFIIGLFLGIVYSRSRNLVSVTIFHWWFNLQNQIIEYLAFLVIS